MLQPVSLRHEYATQFPACSLVNHTSTFATTGNALILVFQWAHKFLMTDELALDVGGLLHYTPYAVPSLPYQM